MSTPDQQTGVCKIGKIINGISAYADDVIILCERLKSPKECIVAIEHYFNQHEITINAAKYNFILFGKINRNVEREQIMLNNIGLYAVLEILYLGWMAYINFKE